MYRSVPRARSECCDPALSSFWSSDHRGCPTQTLEAAEQDADRTPRLSKILESNRSGRCYFRLPAPPTTPSSAGRRSRSSPPGPSFFALASIHQGDENLARDQTEASNREI